MKRLTFYMALLALLVGQAGAVTWYFGGTSSDTTGLGLVRWKGGLTAAMTAATTGDVLTQIDASSNETLSAEYSCTKNFTINGADGYNWTITSSDGGISASNLKVPTGTTLNINQLAMVGGGVAIAGGTLTWTGGSFTFPASGTKVLGTGGAITLGTAACTVTFDNCDITSLSSSAVRIYTSGDFSHKLTLKNLWTNLGIGGSTATWAGTGRIIVENCVLQPLSDWQCTMDLRYIRMSGSVWNAAKEFAITQADSIVVQDNTFMNWGNTSFGGAAVYIAMPTASADLSARNAWVNRNYISPGDSTLGRSGIYISDSTAASIYNLRGNIIGQYGAREDTINYAIRILKHHPTVMIDSNTVYSGVVYFTLADTTKAPGVHTANGLRIDHTNWDLPTLNVALSCVTRGQTWDGLYVKSPISHIIMFSSDDFINKSPGRTTAFRYGGDMVLQNSTIWGMSPATGTAYGIVDKAKNVKLINNVLRCDGGPDGGSIYSFVGDSAKVYNCDITASSVGTLGGVFNSGAYTGMQTKGNAVYNCIVRGTADYTFISRSGNGTGIAESNNCWALSSGGFDMNSVIPMSSTSFTDSTSWRMQWGGKGGLTGMTDSAQGFQAVGVSTASPGQPAIARQQTGFRTPKEALESIRSIGGLKGVELDAYIVNPQDRANLKIWQYAPHPAGGYLQTTASDTLRVRSAIR